MVKQSLLRFRDKVMLSLLKKGTSRFFSENLKNPGTILIKNKFYPSGLTENDIYQYYLQNKKNILDSLNSRDVMLFLQTDKGIIVKRKDKQGSHFRLNNNNYNDLIHGRVLSIHSTMNHNEDIAIVDIDIDNFRLAKSATGVVFDYLKKSESFKSIKIRYTGKESFHIFIKFHI